MELDPVTRKTLLICGWCGPLTIIIALVGWLIAGVLPFPLGPGNSAEEVARFYAGGTHVPLGIIISSVALGLVGPLVASITYIMWKFEPQPILTLMQLVTGAATVVCLILPMMIMAVAGFRADRGPELMVLLNDVSWLLFITPIAPFIIQNISIAAATLSCPNSIFPRWLGFLNLFVGFSFTFDILTYAYKAGPLAWNGFLVFWLALTTYSIWVIAMGVVIIRIASKAPVRGHQELVHGYK